MVRGSWCFTPPLPNRGWLCGLSEDQHFLFWDRGGEGGGRVGVFYPTGYTYHIPTLMGVSARNRLPIRTSWVDASATPPPRNSPRAEPSSSGSREGEAIWGLLGRQELVDGL